MAAHPWFPIRRLVIRLWQESRQAARDGCAPPAAAIIVQGQPWLVRWDRRLSRHVNIDLPRLLLF